MMPLTGLFHRYAPAIMELPLGRPYTREELLTDKFLIYKEDKIEMYYAPHNEYVNPRAKVVIVGITPGWTEMEMAFRKARVALEQGLTLDEIGKHVKIASQFAGTTRANLVTMLDCLGLQYKLGISSCSELFEHNKDLMYATAALGYPVFVAGDNYNGHRPPLHSVSFLHNWAVQSLSNELLQMERPLLIPLGKTVADVLQILVEEGRVGHLQCLWGFPHPSGANAHRHTQFAKAFNQMQEQISDFF